MMLGVITVSECQVGLREGRACFFEESRVSKVSVYDGYGICQNEVDQCLLSLVLGSLKQQNNKKPLHAFSVDLDCLELPVATLKPGVAGVIVLSV